MSKITDIVRGKMPIENAGTALADLCQSPVKVKHFNQLLGKFEDICVPCGKCASCRYVRQSDWVTRMTLQSMSEFSKCVYFVTLTYDRALLDEHTQKELHCVKRSDDSEEIVPVCLNMRHYQLYLKRLRKSNKDVKIKYFVAGEYGKLRLRPHFHLLLWSSAPLSSIVESWNFGHVDVEDLVANGTLSDIRSDSPKNVSNNKTDFVTKYVLKYVQKEQSFAAFKKSSLTLKAFETYVKDQTFEAPLFGQKSSSTFSKRMQFFSKQAAINFPEDSKESKSSFEYDFESYCARVAPFTRCSLRTAIGFDAYSSDSCKIDYIKCKVNYYGLEYPLPRYFKRLSRLEKSPFALLSQATGSALTSQLRDTDLLLSALRLSRDTFSLCDYPSLADLLHRLGCDVSKKTLSIDSDGLHSLLFANQLTRTYYRLDIETHNSFLYQFEHIKTEKDEEDIYIFRPVDKNEVLTSLERQRRFLKDELLRIAKSDQQQQIDSAVFMDMLYAKYDPLYLQTEADLIKIVKRPILDYRKNKQTDYNNLHHDKELLIIKQNETL